MTWDHNTRIRAMVLWSKGFHPRDVARLVCRDVVSLTEIAEREGWYRGERDRREAERPALVDRRVQRAISRAA
jgi:hypothetical protein